MKYHEFVQQHIGGCAGATQQEKMKACGALWRKQRDGKGLTPPGAHVARASPMVGGKTGFQKMMEEAKRARVEEIADPRNQNHVALPPAARARYEASQRAQYAAARPPTPRDPNQDRTLMFPKIGPGSSSRARGGNVECKEHGCPFSTCYVLHKKKGGKGGRGFTGGAGLMAPGQHRRGGKTGVINDVISSLLGKGVHGRRKGGAAEGALASLLHGLTVAIK